MTENQIGPRAVDCFTWVGRLKYQGYLTLHRNFSIHRQAEEG